MTIPMVVGFDVEPDGLDIPRRERPRWLGFERTLAVCAEMRHRLESMLDQPVRFSWFLRMDPQITDVYGSPLWVMDTYGRELEGLSSQGDEIGLHPHALRWDDHRAGWLTDTASASWVEECVLVSFDAYRSAFGAACRVHRFGDRYLSNDLVALLDRLNVAIDLTIEPGRAELDSSSMTRPAPDMMFAPRQPYRPDPANFLLPAAGASGGPWMVPLTSADPDQMFSLWRRIGRRLRHPGQPLQRPILLWAPWPSDLLWDLVATDVEAGALTVLPFMVRADTLLVDSWRESLQAHLLALPGHRLGKAVQLTTASDAMAQLASDGT